MTHSRLAACGLAVWLAVHAVTEAQGPVFRSRVDLVTVDTRVLDSEGRPLLGLEKDDFVLTVGGRPRPIESLEFVASEEGRPGQSLPGVTANDVRLDGRVVLVVVDRANIKRGEGRQAMEGLAGFVERLSPADRVGLATLPDGGPTVSLTADRRAVAAALRRVRGLEGREEGNPWLGMTAGEAIRIADGDNDATRQVISRNCLGMGERPKVETGADGAAPTFELERCAQAIRRGAQTSVQETRVRNANTVARLDALMEGFQAIEGRKVLVFVSEGLAFDRELQRLVQSLASRASRFGTAFYAVQTYTAPPDTTAYGVPVDWDEDRRLRAEGLTLIANASGGAIFRAGPDAANVFERLSREVSARYVLTFQVGPGERDGRPRDIRVALKNGRGRIVRHRSEFVFDPVQRDRRDPETLGAALAEPLPIPNLPLRVGTFAVPDADTAADRMKVLVNAEIGQASAAAAKAETAFEIFDGDGRKVAKVDDVVSAAAAPLRYVTAVRLTPGRYRLRMAAKDGSGRLGSVEHAFEVGSTSTALDLDVGDLLLVDPDASAASAPRLVFDLAPGQRVLAAHLLARAANANVWTGITAALEIADATGITRHHRPMTLAAGGADDLRTFDADVEAAHWGVGAYTATATVSRGGEVLAKVTRSFHVPEAAEASEAVVTSARPAEAPRVAADELVRRASEYVGQYADRAASVVAEEHYVQAVFQSEPAAGQDTAAVMAWHEGQRGPRPPGLEARRQLQSDLLMVRAHDGWYTNYRDVSVVDGRPVKNRDQRALTLFTSARGEAAGASLRRITEEGSRYNLGNLQRTVNVPTLPLFALHDRHRARFAFEPVGQAEVGGVATTIVRFRETRGPTFVATPRGDYVFSRGALWIADDGRVLKTRLDLEPRDSGMAAAIDVSYTMAEGVGLLMPAVMEERYTKLPGDKGRVIAGRATYGNFRRFVVNTEEQIK